MVHNNRLKTHQSDAMLGIVQMAQIGEAAVHVVKMLSVVSSAKGPMMILLEPCDYTLEGYLEHKIGLGTADKIKMLADVADGMSELESLGFVHGSLNLRNVPLIHLTMRQIQKWDVLQEKMTANFKQAWA
jgi:hypothetical protein